VGSLSLQWLVFVDRFTAISYQNKCCNALAIHRWLCSRLDSNVKSKEHTEMGAVDVYKVSRIAAARSMQRAITASVLSKVRNVEEALVLRQSFPRDEHAEIILRGAVSPTMASANAGIISADLIGIFRSLAPGSAALRLFDASTKLDLAGINTIRIPHVATLPKQPIFIGEGQPAPALQFSLAGTTLGPARKIVVLSGVTRELNEATPDTAAAVIGSVLASATNASIDKVAFDAAPADSTRPAGLLNGVVPIAAEPSGGQITLGEMMARDLANLAGAIGSAGIDPSNVIFAAGPREALLAQALVENDVLMTLGLPAKSVAAFAPAAVYSGYQDVPTIVTSTETAIHMEDTAPAEIVSTPGVVAAPDVSYFQQELIAIRVRAWAAWAVIPGGAQIVEGVNW
jgi:hypothetical protein